MADGRWEGVQGGKLELQKPKSWRAPATFRPSFSLARGNLLAALDLQNTPHQRLTRDEDNSKQTERIYASNWR
jgi:hypothetical protein